MISDTGSIVAQCACGGTFTLQQFRALPVPLYWTEYGLESRQCSCGSHTTISVDENGNLAKEAA